MILVFVPLLLIMYFMILRPQQQRMKEQRALLAALEPGDDIITAAGVYGTIVEFEGDGAWLEIAEGIEIKITRASIERLVPVPSDDEVDAELETADADDE